MISLLESAFLGIVQGLTEFFPVSSSGHLVIFQELIPDFSQPGVLFDVFLHLGTALSVIIYFKKDVVSYIKGNTKYLIIALAPAVFVGFFFSDFLEGLFDSTRVVSAALLITTFFNYFADRFSGGKKLNEKSAFIVGCFQALAIVPGISRSGSTIFAGRVRGLNTEDAVKFSFILSVPAILGASLLQLVKYGVSDSIQVSNYIVGFITAFMAGFFAIHFLLKLVKTTKYRYFAYYTFLVSLLTLVFT